MGLAGTKAAQCKRGSFLYSTQKPQLHCWELGARLYDFSSKIPARDQQTYNQCLRSFGDESSGDPTSRRIHTNECSILKSHYSNIHNFPLEMEHYLMLYANYCGSFESMMQSPLQPRPSAYQNIVTSQSLYFLCEYLAVGKGFNSVIVYQKYLSKRKQIPVDPSLPNVRKRKRKRTELANAQNFLDQSIRCSFSLNEE